MGISRGGSLVADVAGVVKLTTKLDLLNLEVDGEISLADALVTANDWVFDKLETQGDPVKLENPNRYERAVAWYFMHLLAGAGNIGGPDGDLSYLDLAVRSFDEVWPRFSDSDDPRSGSEGIPRVSNISTNPLFGRLP